MQHYSRENLEIQKKGNIKRLLLLYFYKKKNEKKKHNSHFNEIPKYCINRKRTRATHSAHEEHTQSSILYPKFPVLLWQIIELFNFTRIMKTKAI